MIEFKRNKDNGKVEVWKDGEKVGEIETMGDEVTGDAVRVQKQSGRSSEGYSRISRAGAGDHRWQR